MRHQENSPRYQVRMPPPPHRLRSVRRSATASCPRRPCQSKVAERPIRLYVRLHNRYIRLHNSYNNNRYHLHNNRHNNNNHHHNNNSSVTCLVLQARSQEAFSCNNPSPNLPTNSSRDLCTRHSPTTRIISNTRGISRRYNRSRSPNGPPRTTDTTPA